MEKGVTEEDVARWRDSDREAREAMYSTDPNLAALEEEQVKKRLDKYKNPALGSLVTEKQEEYFRFLGAQVNGLSSKMARAVKTLQLTELINRYDVDMITMQEPGVNWSNLPPSHNLTSFSALRSRSDQSQATTAMKSQNPPINKEARASWPSISMRSYHTQRNQALTSGI